jgi:hypothetical protein
MNGSAHITASLRLPAAGCRSRASLALLPLRLLP